MQIPSDYQYSTISPVLPTQNLNPHISDRHKCHTSRTEGLGHRTACRKSKGNNYQLLFKNQLAFCQPSCVGCSSSVGFAEFLGEAGKDAAYCRLRGVSENIPSKFSTRAHKETKASSGTGICPHSNLPVRFGRTGPQPPQLRLD